ncbi:MAG: decaprenyl-phosphate phosphoribosyltransferase [Prevotella sp.]|nr:decaprenyl-phosphate phosphoribosyltransferase [Prevotella sp.]
MQNILHLWSKYLLPVIRIVRPRQWVKNFFVFIPLFFGGQMSNTALLLDALTTFVAFSLAASSIYCLNDIVDVEADRQHPVKCHRPIASGQVSVSAAYVLMAIMLILSMTVCPMLKGRSMAVGAVVLGYWIMNIAYCVWLKNFAIIDVCLIAFGFVLRILAGGLATGIEPSNWLVLMTFLLTLFLSFAKRRDDVLRMEATGKPPRKNTIRYNLTFINQAITISASITLVCYIMYTVSPEVTARFNSHYIYLTTIFVLVGLLRYIQIAVVDKQSGDPTKIILRDRFTQLVVLAWMVSFLFIIYY